jgi:hypothetical protein
VVSQIIDGPDSGDSLGSIWSLCIAALGGLEAREGIEDVLLLLPSSSVGNGVGSNKSWVGTSLGTISSTIGSATRTIGSRSG